MGSVVQHDLESIKANFVESTSMGTDGNKQSEVHDLSVLDLVYLKSIGELHAPNEQRFTTPQIQTFRARTEVLRKEAANAFGSALVGKAASSGKMEAQDSRTIAQRPPCHTTGSLQGSRHHTVARVHDEEQRTSSRMTRTFSKPVAWTSSSRASAASLLPAGRSCSRISQSFSLSRRMILIGMRSDSNTTARDKVLLQAKHI